MRPTFGIISILWVSFFLAGARPIPLWAGAFVEETDKEFTQRVVKRQQDFEKHLERQKQGSETKRSEAQKILRERAERETRHEALRAKYVNRMKRYSMEEVEALEREDQLRREQGEKDNRIARDRFIRRRDRLSEIERTKGFIDPYRELKIDFSNEPEAKTSAAEKIRN